uniref:Uncharacterized protein n=1 Tax=Meloidogyne floridensis TaxID=298350 RepID=A0A915NHM8_9BILA
MFPRRKQGYGYHGEGAVPPQNNQRARQAAVLPHGYRPNAYNLEPSAAELANFHRFPPVDQIGQNLPLINRIFTYKMHVIKNCLLLNNLQHPDNLHNNAIEGNVQHEEIAEDSYPPQISDDESEVSSSGTTNFGGSSRDIYGGGSSYGIHEEGSGHGVYGGVLVYGTPGEGSGHGVYGGESKTTRNTRRKN